jgi:hypothetical protein
MSSSRRRGRDATAVVPSPSRAARYAPETPRSPAISTNENPQKNFKSTRPASSGSSAARPSSASASRSRSVEPSGARAGFMQRSEGQLAATLHRVLVPHVVGDQAAHGARRVRTGSDRGLGRSGSCAARCQGRLREAASSRSASAALRVDADVHGPTAEAHRTKPRRARPAPACRRALPPRTSGRSDRPSRLP